VPLREAPYGTYLALEELARTRLFLRGLLLASVHEAVVALVSLGDEGVQALVLPLPLLHGALSPSDQGHA
jgi:hypothetical protein